MKGQKFIYFLIALQLLAWGYHQWKGGQLAAQHYYIFCALMMAGQLGAGVECFVKRSWGTFVVQVYFFVWTGVGWLQRYLATS